MFVEDTIDVCFNELTIEGATAGDLISILSFIRDVYKVLITESQNVIKFCSNWVVPITFFNNLSFFFPSLQFTLFGYVEGRLASKSFHKCGLIDVKEVSFNERESLKDFIWPRM